MTATEIPTPPTIWERLFATGEGQMSPDVACTVLKLDFSAADHARMAELSSGAAAGTLTPSERAELAEFVRVGHQLARLQSLARVALRRLTAPGNGHG